MSTCVAGKTKRANGYRIFQRRLDKIYPSVDDLNDATYARTLNVSNKPNDPLNSYEVKRKRGRPPLYNEPGVKRKRGRPQLYSNEVKRKRGRPPKYTLSSPQKAVNTGEPSNDTSRVDEVDFCDICGSNADEEKLLVCENHVAGQLPVGTDDIAKGSRLESQHAKLQCFGSAHTFCLGLRRIPKGDWYCSECVSALASQVRFDTTRST